MACVRRVLTCIPELRPRPSPVLTPSVAAAAAGLTAHPLARALRLSSTLSPLQGKEEFEKTQKELLEKGGIPRQGKGQLEPQQVRAPTLAASAGAAVPGVRLAS